MTSPNKTHNERSFVLLHGGGLGSWAWQRVMPLLQLRSLAVDLPGRNRQPGDVRRMTITDCAEHVVNAIQQAGLGQIILVVHSYSGVLAAPLAARLGERVSHVVLVGACVPVPGQSVLDTMTPNQRRATTFGLRVQQLGLPLPRVMVHRTLRQTVCNDMDVETTQMLLDRFVINDVIALFRERAALRLPPTLPCTYIKLTRDRGALPPSYQDRVIVNLGHIDVRRLDTGHTAMLSRPQELAALLNDIASSGCCMHRETAKSGSPLL